MGGMIMKKVIAIALAFCLLSFNICCSAISTSAKASILINGDTGEVIYKNNENMQLSMASTTKIMTSLLLCEYGHFEETVTVTKEMVAVEGTSMGLLPDDTVSLHDLLYGMLLASGNDAANTTAIVISGSVVNFVELMNKRAMEIGMKNTHFATPSGLDDNTHYSTAYDMALLAKTALQNKKFAEACSAKSANLCYGNPPYNRTLKNHNRLLNMYEGCIGVKTGFTKKSGRCLVSAAKQGNKFLIAVTLNDKNDWQDHIALFDYGFSVLKEKNVNLKNNVLSVPIINGNKHFTTAYIDQISVSSACNAQIDYKLNVKEFLYAPVKKGQVIGTTDYYLNDKLYKTIPITSNMNVDYKPDKQNKFLKYFSIIKTILANF